MDTSCWVAVSAASTLLTVIATFVVAGLAWKQNSIARLSAGVNLLIHFEDRFESEEIRNKRKAAAKAMREKDLVDKGSIEDIFDYFETLALLTRRKALDKEMVWSSFFYWVYGYCKYGQEFIRQEQRAYPTRYTEVVWLKDEIVRIEKQKSGMINENEWRDFLPDEGQC